MALGAITANLLFWTIPLTLTVIAQQASASRRWQDRCDRLVEWIYRRAVRFDSACLKLVCGVTIDVHGQLPADRRELIVVSNHRSWFDILLLQHVIASKGPILKFLIKRELAWVPVVGWICLALRFPRLERGGSAESRQRDYALIQKAASEAGTSGFAILNFAEGTRFSEAKRDAQRSEFQYLLNPRAGGLRMMCASLPSAQVVDVTIIYPDFDISFWRCLSGALDTVKVYLKVDPAPTSDEIGEYLASSWRAKEFLHRLRQG